MPLLMLAAHKEDKYFICQSFCLCITVIIQISSTILGAPDWIRKGHFTPKMAQLYSHYLVVFIWNIHDLEWLDKPPLIALPEKSL